METKNNLFSEISMTDWNDWHWQFANRIITIEDLDKVVVVLSAEERKGIQTALGKWSSNI